MRPALQLLSKINQLCTAQRRDVIALMEALAPRANRTERLVRILARQIGDDYLKGWSAAAGGGRCCELAKFLRGGFTHLLLPAISLVHLHSNADFLLFSALFPEDFGLETFVCPDAMEIFYVLEGSLELTLKDRRGHLRMRVSGGEVIRVDAGHRYQLSAAGGTLALVVHSKPAVRAERQPDTRQQKPVARMQPCAWRRTNESRGSGTA